MAHTLRRPAGEDDWRAFHDIREAVLFIGRHSEVAYDRNHPEDLSPQNTPLLLKRDGRPIGTARLDDFGDGTGCVRLVAILAAEQGGGHGRALSALWEEEAREKRLHTLYVNSAPDAVGFYEKLGWQLFAWSPAELSGIASDCVQMRKVLAP